MTIQQLLILKGYLVGSWLLCFFIAERLKSKSGYTTWPHDRSSWGRLVRNGCLWLLNTGLSPLVVLPLSFWASQFQLQWRPDWWQGGFGLILDLLLLDCWIYWWHRANHQWPLLWRFHRIHHLDQQLDTTSAVRFHFGEVILSSLVRVAVIVALGVPFESVVAFEILVMLAAIFHHSDISLPETLERTLSRIVITPSIHWIHHHAVRADTDSNYGTVLSGWDRLFGTNSKAVRSPSMTIGVEGESELPYLKLLIAPFISSVKRRRQSE